MSLPLAPSFSCSRSFSGDPIRVPAHLLEHHSTSLPPFWHTYTKTGFVALCAYHHIGLSRAVISSEGLLESISPKSRERKPQLLSCCPGTWCRPSCYGIVLEGLKWVKTRTILLVLSLYLRHFWLPVLCIFLFIYSANIT